MKLTCSVGAAAVPETVSQVAHLLTAADAALYHAKSRGRANESLIEGWFPEFPIEGWFPAPERGTHRL